MRKAISILALVVISSAASADWVKAVTSDPVDIYVEPASIKQAGNKMKIWELHNYDSLQELNGKRVLSLKTQTEYDCEKERFRSLAGVGYARKMGEGDVRFTDNEPDKWAPVVPGTIGEEVWKLVCGEQQS